MKVIVRAPNWIGDAVLALPALESLHNSMPAAEIWLAGRGWAKDLIHSLDFIRGFIPAPNSARPLSLWKSAKELREYRFDAGLLLTNSFASALIFYLAGIPQRWGYARDGRGRLLTNKVRYRSEDGCHQMLYYRNLVSRLGFKAEQTEFSFRLAESESRKAKNRLASLALVVDKPLVILNPGAAYGPAKRWPVPHFAELASLFQKRAGAQILIVGSPSERSLGESIASRMEGNSVVLSGETSLLQLAGILSQASLFVTNDTGPMHLANALRIPVVAIFGPTDPDATAPVQQPSAVVFKKADCWPCKYRECPTDHKCLSEISAEEVFLACKRFLK